MKCSFAAEVSCLLTFTNEQWVLIMNSFHRHYDIDLRSTANVGGWLFGLNNHRILTSDKESLEIRFTFRQVDGVIKSIEQDHSELARDLDKKLRQVTVFLSGVSHVAKLFLKPLTIDNV